MLEEMLAHLAEARDDDAVRVARPLLQRPHGPLGRRRRPGAARRGGQGAPHAALRRPLRRAHRLPEADDRRLPRRRRRRRRRDRGRLRHAGRRLEPAAALPRRGARRPGRPGAPGHALRPVGRQVPAALLADRRRRRGAAPRAGQPGRAGGRDRGGGAGAGRGGRRAPARGGRPAEADAARVGRTSRDARRPRAGARSSGSAPGRACRFLRGDCGGARGGRVRRRRGEETGAGLWSATAFASASARRDWSRSAELARLSRAPACRTRSRCWRGRGDAASRSWTSSRSAGAWCRLRPSGSRAPTGSPPSQLLRSRPRRARPRTGARRQHGVRTAAQRACAGAPAGFRRRRGLVLPGGMQPRARCRGRGLHEPDPRTPPIATRAWSPTALPSAGSRARD